MLHSGRAQRPGCQLAQPGERGGARSAWATPEPRDGQLDPRAPPAGSRLPGAFRLAAAAPPPSKPLVSPPAPPAWQELPATSRSDGGGPPPAQRQGRGGGVFSAGLGLTGGGLKAVRGRGPRAERGCPRGAWDGWAACWTACGTPGQRPRALCTCSAGPPALSPSASGAFWGRGCCSSRPPAPGPARPLAATSRGPSPRPARSAPSPAPQLLLEAPGVRRRDVARPPGAAARPAAAEPRPEPLGRPRHQPDQVGPCARPGPAAPPLTRPSGSPGRDGAAAPGGFRQASQAAFGRC